MKLAIDIGNTKIKIGFFNEDNLESHHVLNSNEVSKLRRLLSDTYVTHTIVCKVTDYPTGWKELLMEKSAVVIDLDPSTPLPFINEYKNRKTVGPDRLAAISGAWTQFKNNNILVVNAGTCITYDFIDVTGKYRGGAISPGREMRFRSLHDFTARLPLIEADVKFKSLIGVTTEECILSGVQNGIINEINGTINQYNERFKNLKTLITGGATNWLKLHIKGEINVEPMLTLKGLNVILSLCLEK
jgi:type III pantothenate kinase